MIIEHIQPFNGQHCETTATGTLLNYLNINLSEPMLFGLGQGLGFIFWNMKIMDFPFLGGRIKPDVLTHNLARHLNLELIAKETSSPQKAWDAVKSLINSGQPVGLKLDSYHLEYFTKPIHFAGHYVAIYGYDPDMAYLVDTQQQGSWVKTSLQSLALARNEKGPMSSRNLYYTLNKTGVGFDLGKAIPAAIRNNAVEYLNPPIANLGYKGILKTSAEIIAWFKRSKDVKTEFGTTAMLMEKAGTGGALFRNLYRDFLGESYERLNHPALKSAHELFTEAASLWNRVSSLFEQAAQTGDIQFIYQASTHLKEISAIEKKAMEILTTEF